MADHKKPAPNARPVQGPGRAYPDRLGDPGARPICLGGAMKSMGLDRELADSALIAKSLEALFSHGWVLDQEPLLISERLGGSICRSKANAAGSDLPGLPSEPGPLH
jgi:hypothetical protein